VHEFFTNNKLSAVLHIRKPQIYHPGKFLILKFKSKLKRRIFHVISMIQKQWQATRRPGKTTSANVVNSGANVVSSGANVVSSGANVVSSGANVVNSGANVVNSGANVVNSGANVVSSGANVVNSGANENLVVVHVKIKYEETLTLLSCVKQMHI